MVEIQQNGDLSYAEKLVRGGESLRRMRDIGNGMLMNEKWNSDLV